MSYYTGGYSSGGYGPGGYGPGGYGTVSTKPKSQPSYRRIVNNRSTVQGVNAKRVGSGITPDHMKFNPRKLFIGGVSKRETTEASFNTFFQKYGEVEHVILNRAQDGSGGHRGFGFVTFKEQSGADAVLADTGKLELDGRKLDAKLALPPSLKPPPGTDTTKLFIGSLPKDASKPTSEELKEYFSAFGDVEDTWVSQEKGFGFVTFKHENGAYKALARSITGEHLVNGSAKIDIKWPKPKNSTDSNTYGSGPYNGGGGQIGTSNAGYASYGGGGAYGRGDTTFAPPTGRLQPY